MASSTPGTSGRRAQAPPAAQRVADGEDVVVHAGHVEKRHQRIARRFGPHHQPARQDIRRKGDEARQRGQAAGQSRHRLVVGVDERAVQVEQDRLDGRRVKVRHGLSSAGASMVGP
jgi:hypothetical protein